MTGEASAMRRTVVGLILGALVLGLVHAEVPGARGPTPSIGFDAIRGAFREFVGGRPAVPRSVPIALADVPRHQAAPIGKPAPAARRVSEIVDRRTENAAFFQLSDGRIQAEVSTTPVHYRDSRGALQKIDTRVRPATGPGTSFANTTNTFASSFGTSTDRLATFDLGGRRVTIGAAGPARPASPTAQGDTVTFTGAFGPGADVAYHVASGQLKEDVVLTRPPVQSTFTFTVDPHGLTAKANADGSIGFYPGDRDTAPLLVMPKPFMYDSAKQPAESARVTQTLRWEGNRLTVALTADEGWLRDPARVYPVVLDPTIKIQPTVSQSQDAMITSDDPAANFDGSWRLSVGTTTAARARSLVKFDLTGVPAGTSIDSANLELYFDQDHTTGAFDVPIEARRVTAPWTESTVTWNGINTAVGEVGANVETVDNADTGKTAINGEWAAATHASAVAGAYRYNRNTPTGETFTWVPRLTESGDYVVETHYVAGADRPTAAPYTVKYSGGQQGRTVNQTSGTNGVWAGLGTYPFVAGTSHSVVLGDVADASRTTVADAVRLTKPGTAVKRANQSSVWHSYSVRNIVQSWLDGAQANHGFMLKAVDEATLGRGGPRYEAAEYAYNGENENTPKLVLTYGKPGVSLHAPKKIHSTGAELSWTAYAGTDLIEYQVHRAVFQTFTPSAATLVAPVKPGVTAFTDTTATPTPVDSADPFGQVYYYMIAVKTTTGELIPAPTRIARLPRAGRSVALFQGDALDTTLSSTESTTGHDVLAGNPWLSVGNNSGTYGRTRAAVRFPSLSAIPAGARVLDASFQLWSVTTIPAAGATYEARALTRTFDEATASWTKADATTAWTTAGGDHGGVADTVTGNSNDPAWREFTVNGIVQGWVDAPATNNGLLVRLANETTPAERTLFLSSEAPEPELRPKLVVTYTEKTPIQTYFAPSTPTIRMIPGDLYTIPVTVSNPTGSTWTPAQWVLSYRWTLPDGTDVTTGGNQLDTPLPADVPPGGAVDVNAQVRTPIQSDSGNKRHEYVLKWELRNKVTGQWLSTTDGIGALDQPVVVEDPTSDELGLEKFHQYTVSPTGAGVDAMVNLHAGNTVVTYSPISNPSRGFSTFVRMTYNSMDTSASSMGHGWSLTTSTFTRLGSPLQFHPPGQDWPTRVTLTDGDGTSHFFSLDKHGSPDPALWEYDSPAGVHLFLQKNSAAGDPTRAWVMTRPDRTQIYFDDDGYPSSTVDRNGNTLTFTYAERRSNNKPTKFLQYLTDTAGRRTLALDYYAKGDTYFYLNDAGDKVQATNLTNPKIIDQVKSLVDVSGRRLELTYTDKGLLGELIDGAGSPLAKIFRFTYDMTQGNKNVKLVRITDPRGAATALTYFDAPTDPKDKWKLQRITDRRGGATDVSYVDPDGSAGSEIVANVTDPEAHTATYRMDGFGRPTIVTDARGKVNELTWDAENKVVRHKEPNGAITTWTYDAKTGHPLTITDAEANANGTAATRLAYRTGLDGHVADLTDKTSPQGRKWTFGYDAVGNLLTVTDPKGTVTADPNDFTTRYAYDGVGQLTAATDANGNTTTYNDYDPTGYPRTDTDPFGKVTRTAYDIRGNVVSVTDALNKTSTYQYDLFGRPGETRVPKSGSETIVTPAPVYDPNDNVTRTIAPNGATTTSTFDAADRALTTDLPKDTPTGPARTVSYTYDRVGNMLTETEPKGNLTPDPNDFVTRYTYDEIYQLVEMRDPADGRYTSAYDDVGNMVTMVDARKNATADPNDYTAKYTYDRNHRRTAEIDALGHRVTYGYDLDGNVVTTTDQEGVTTTTDRDERSMVTEVRVPHAAGTTRVTRYEYDQVGNRTKAITPRGVETTDDPNDFAQVTVYDKLNRVVEEQLPFDRDDSRHTTPDKIFYSYDDVSRVTKVSSPPSQGQSVRNDSTYSYFDNGWVRSSTDPWDIVTSYDYTPLGQQASATLTSAGGSSSRTLGWEYYPDSKLRKRTDDGVPVGKHVALVDNSDTQHVDATGSWATSSSGTGFQGFDYRTHGAGGGDTFTWNVVVPADGTYEVSVKFASTATATAAPYTVHHAGGTAARTVNQTANAGTWVSLGSFPFTEGLSHKVVLGAAASGSVVADAVKLVRDNTADVDTEKKTFEYEYDVNGNQTVVRDTSSGAASDNWQLSYDGLNQVTAVAERNGSTVQHTTSFTYDPNGNPLTRTHDRQTATFVYDPRDAVQTVTNAESGVPTKTNTLSYTPKGRVLSETAANGNTVDYEYTLDGLIRHQVEKKAGGAIVNEHTLEYNANGHRTKDIAKTQNADNHAATLDRTYTYEYDPRDRIRKVNRTAVGGAGAKTETYVHDANDNIVEQTVDSLTTTFTYDRNRLQSATAVGGTTSRYNYDPFGRLDTVVSGGQVLEKYRYDGFDRTLEHRAGSGSSARLTRYVYDPFDRTLARTEKAGTPDAKTTDMAYLGVGAEVAAEEVGGTLTRSYHYGPQGERLAMVKHNSGGGKEYSVYGYTDRGDVEVLTNESGNTRTTYGYTAFGSVDKDLMTGVDKPDPGDPDKEPYNTYRFNAKRLDTATGDYDMGARDYDPGLNRFLTRDLYAGALADLGMATDPFTMNRYAFAGGNPISRIEFDGHGWLSSLGHAALDVVGLVPVVGEVADLANAAWYLAEGNYADAALSAAGAIPFVGWGAAAAKGAKYVYKGVDAARTGAKGVDEAVDVVQATTKADVPAGGATPGAPANATTPPTANAPPAGSTPPPAPKPAPAPAPAKPAAGPSSPGSGAPSPTRDPIFADTNVLVNAMKGNANALAEIRAGKTFITPNQFREFVNVPMNATARRGFLAQEGIETFGGARAGALARQPGFQQTFQAIAGTHGRGDAALLAFAKATGYTAVTMEKRLYNFVTQTLRDPSIPIRRIT